MEKRAIIVDDEPATRELIEKVLTAAGIESLTVTKSEEAPEILRHGKFAVAFLGYEMAFPDGPALARQMRASGSNRMTPIVLISDDQRPAAMARGFEAGASFFLYKPIDKDRLVRLLRATQGAIENVERRTRRVPLRSKVRIKFRGQEIEGETVNVSMEGMLIQTPRTLPVGSSVDVSLQLSQAMKAVVGAGSVVRVEGHERMGIHLGRLTLEESQRLQEYLLPLLP
ncbi:MAG TPA: response regulator [Candidatus Acidoferrum sp.]|nr:response regulator [Candidatus Acidoferrum sp.]